MDSSLRLRVLDFAPLRETSVFPAKALRESRKAQRVECVLGFEFRVKMGKPVTHDS